MPPDTQPDASDRSQTPWPINEPHLNVPRLTIELPGVGGSIKQVPEDFQVEEIPAYEPCGTGEHLFLWIEKRGVAAEALIRHVAGSLGISANGIGVAGLKDRHALTRQFVSVPCSASERVKEIDTPEIRVLDAKPHRHKLRTGHLAGNRFRIVVRDVVADAAERAAAVREKLLETGLPNFFGHQRFGRDAETALLGMQLLRGEIDMLPGHRSRQRFLRKLALSAAQAVLFNRYLTCRLEDGLLRTVLDGDVMFKLSGGIFYVTDRAVEQARLDRRETVHAGPIFGKKTFAARAEAAAREAVVLAEAGVTLDRLRKFGPLLNGTRRRNLVYVDDLTIQHVPQGLEFRFSLPPGSYATVLLQEFMKTETA